MYNFNLGRQISKINKQGKKADENILWFSKKLFVVPTKKITPSKKNKTQSYRKTVDVIINLRTSFPQKDFDFFYSCFIPQLDEHGDLLNLLRDGARPRGLTNERQIKEHFRRIAQMIDSIKAQGYLPQILVEKNIKMPRNFHVQRLYPRKDEICLSVGGSLSDLILNHWGFGHHRLHAAKQLNVDFVFAYVRKVDVFVLEEIFRAMSARNIKFTSNNLEAYVQAIFLSRV